MNSFRRKIGARGAPKSDSYFFPTLYVTRLMFGPYLGNFADPIVADPIVAHRELDARPEAQECAPTTAHRQRAQNCRLPKVGGTRLYELPLQHAIKPYHMSNIFQYETQSIKTRKVMSVNVYETLNACSAAPACFRQKVPVVVIQPVAW